MPHRVLLSGQSTVRSLSTDVLAVYDTFSTRPLGGGEQIAFATTLQAGAFGPVAVAVTSTDRVAMSGWTRSSATFPSPPEMSPPAPITVVPNGQTAVTTLR